MKYKIRERGVVNRVRLMSLDYAEKNRVVNQKAIKAFVDGYTAGRERELQYILDDVLEEVKIRNTMNGASRTSYEKYIAKNKILCEVERLLVEARNLIESNEIW